MKFCLISLFVMLMAFSASAQKVVTAKEAHRHFGKQVTVEAKLCGWLNSPRSQSAWLYLGPDTLHKQMQVVIEGALYPKFNFNSTGEGPQWIGSYVNKTVQITGIVKGNRDEVYLEATGMPVLKTE